MDLQTPWLAATLLISFMLLTTSSILVQGAKEIAELLKRNSTLRVIELNNNMIDYSVSFFFFFYSCAFYIAKLSILVYELNLVCVLLPYPFEMEGRDSQVLLVLFLRIIQYDIYISSEFKNVDGFFLLVSFLLYFIPLTC